MKQKIFIIVILILLTFIHAFITKPIQNRYEVVSLNDNNYIIIDHKQEKIYQKYIESNSGPTNFTEIELPE